MSEHEDRFWESGEPGVPAPPGQEGTCPPHPRWTKAETWAWEQIRDGEAADFNIKLRDTLKPSDKEVWKDEEVREQRLLSPEFLATILLNQPWRGAITNFGVRIIGALFDRKIDLRRADIHCELWLNECRVERGLNFGVASFAKFLALDKSSVDESMNLNNIKALSAIRLVNGQYPHVDIIQGQIDGQLNMRGSLFKGKVLLDRVRIAGHLFMDSVDEEHRTEFRGEVNLAGAGVGGQVILVGSTFSEILVLYNAVVEDSLFIDGATLEKVNASYVQISGSMTLRKVLGRTTSMELFDLTGASVESIVDGWTPERDAVGADPWPQILNLQNFTYKHVHGRADEEGWVPITARPASWFVKWLARQSEFSPQPYEHCAKVLRAAGALDTANKVLYACKERERKQAAGWRRVGMSLMKAFIGYGLGAKYFRVLYWAGALSIVGFLVAWCSSSSTAKEWYWFFGFSLDQLLPIVSLSKDFDPKILSGLPWAYFIFLHKPLGFVLASFVVAGLAGVGNRSAE